MYSKVKRFVKPVIRPVYVWIRERLNRRILRKCMRYDMARFCRYAGCIDPFSQRESLQALIIKQYHVVEKGLTMPNRRLGFGKSAVFELMQSIDFFNRKYSARDEQVQHAIGVVRAYYEMHRTYDFGEGQEFIDRVKCFCERHKDVPISVQPHVTREEFFAHNDDPFPVFSSSRHTIRHYAGPVCLGLIQKAVELAMNAPSACNRGHSRVYCMTDKDKIKRLLKLQRGSRGFGDYADKVIVVTADLKACIGHTERNDVWLNGGMFLMNLCYALHYYRIVHCVLNWSQTPAVDKSARKLIGVIPNSETILAILTCGAAPEEFDIAASPKKNFREIYTEVHK